MPRANAPAPLRLDKINNNQQEELFNGRFAERYLTCKQIVGNLNPKNITTIGSLGKGNSGSVTKIRHEPSGEIYARKVIWLEINPTERNRIMQELEVLKDCHSEFIVSYSGACFYNCEINLFMEYMDGGSLDSILKKICNLGSKFPEEILGKITVAVVKGLIYLRDNLNIMHRDIKPSNILVNSEGKIKLCDFGVSGQLAQSAAQSYVGTRRYMAPERIIGEIYTVASDIWSVGITLAELTLQRHPISQYDPNRQPGEEPIEMDIFEDIDSIVKHPLPPVPGSEVFKDFVDICLKKLPQERFNLRTIMRHEFFALSEKSEVDVASWVKHFVD